MNVIASDLLVDSVEIELDFFDGQSVKFKVKIDSMEKVIEKSDFISLHVPSQSGYLIGKEEISKMKDGVGIVNASRGGILNEVALLEGLESGKISFAALDVFEEEPFPAMQVLMHDGISLSPHIGAGTLEAQDRIGTELAEQIIKFFKEN